MATDHAATNRAHWDGRVDAHVASPDYAVDRLVEDREHVSSVVAFDVPRMGDVAGRRLLHLQCHIGTDTLSWAKLGARVTGVDFSPKAIAAARDLAGRMGIEDARFVESTLQDAPTVLAGEQFDIVFTGIGALCWLPSVHEWAQVVASLLTPGGKLFIREGHPVLWALDYEREDDVLALMVPYFEQGEPNRWDDEETYVEVLEGTVLADNVNYDWNHGIGEILTAVLDAGLVIERFEEHRSLPWRPFDLFVPSDEHPGEWCLPPSHRELLPLTYTLVARRPD